MDDDTTLDDFKEELWDTVVKFGEPILMGTSLEEKARGELLSKMVELRKAPRKTREDKCKDSSTPKQKTDDKIIEHVRGDKIGTSNIIKSTTILKARAGGRQELEGLDGDKERREVSQEEERRGGIGQYFSGCGLGGKLERDGPHGSGTMEDSSLQE